MVPYRAIILIFSSVISLYCAGQKKTNALYSEFKIDTIPNLISFKHLTQYEVRFDSLMKKQNYESLKSLSNRSAYRKGTSKGYIDTAIREQKILSSIRYRENRSRYELQHYKNGQLLEKTTNDKDLDSIGTECSCMLDNDTLKVRMGIWVFGGFSFPIDITGNKFTSSYWLDEHKRKIYKLSNEDTALTDNILIPITEQQLILDSAPAYKFGEQLTGYFTFKTGNYLRAADFVEWAGQEEYSDKNMDTMYTKGTIRFTCKVREKLQQDE